MQDIDTTALPEAVRKQFEKSKEFLKKASEPPETPEPPAPEETPPVEVPPETKKVDEVTWEQRYKSLQGMYNAEVPKLHSQVKDMTQRMTALEAELQKAKEAPQAPEGTYAELLKMFGPEDPQIKYIDEAQKRIAELESMVKGLNAQIKGVTEHQSASAESLFYAEMDRLDPQWRDTNLDLDLMIWLETTEDPFTGRSRKALFDDAVSELNAKRVIAFFHEFKRQTAPTESQTPKPSAKLKSQVTPSSQGGEATTDNGKPVWTRAQVQSFFDDVVRGKFKGKEAEQERLQQEILAASAEGRIIQ